jgi:UDP-glucose 4-epimerase
MKKIIVVTGGAGFVGSNLINFFLKKTKFNFVSIDNYSTGKKSNHIRNERVKYIRGNTQNIEKLLNSSKKNIETIFHFGEFSRIYQSFKNFDQCYNSNTIGSKAVFKFCLDNKIRLIYSATSATLGNSGNDKNLSPYAFTKSKNLELLENFKKWFNFKYEVIFFYNVYGPNQIKTGEMSTVIGIFENCYEKNLPLPIVRPGTQTRRFTHIFDTILICYEAWKKKKYFNYSVTNKKSYSILNVADMFGLKKKFLPSRKGERFASALTNLSYKNKVHKRYGNIDLKNYINEFRKNN